MFQCNLNIYITIMGGTNADLQVVNSPFRNQDSKVPSGAAAHQ